MTSKRPQNSLFCLALNPSSSVSTNEAWALLIVKQFYDSCKGSQNWLNQSMSLMGRFSIIRLWESSVLPITSKPSCSPWQWLPIHFKIITYFWSFETWIVTFKKTLSWQRSPSPLLPLSLHISFNNWCRQPSPLSWPYLVNFTSTKVASILISGKEEYIWAIIESSFVPSPWWTSKSMTSTRFNSCTRWA